MKRIGTMRTGAVAIAAAVALRCGDSGTVTGPLVTPPPQAAADLSGDWRGIYLGDETCDPIRGAAKAIFQQSGTSVTGTLDGLLASPCGFLDARFEGTFQNGRLDGAVSGGSLQPGSTATGRLRDNTLELTITNGPSAELGLMRLRR